MKFAIDIPNFGHWADPNAVARLASDIEAAGWDGLSIWDHIVVADGLAVGDPQVALAAAATSTEHITLMVMVTPVPRRTPWKLARECVSLDHLSGGRLVLGVGIGWPTDPEFTRFAGPADLRQRADMLDEGLAILEGVWSGEPFEFEGAHYRVERTHFVPTPLQEPRIPIWVAGMWPRRRPFRRAARYDGVAPILMSESGDFEEWTPGDLADIVDYVARHRTEGGSYDVAPSGCAFARSDAEDFLGAMKEAGATWWREGWVPGAMDLNVWTERVLAGPPRL